MMMGMMMQAKINAERQQRHLDGKSGMGPIERTHVEASNANLARHEAEKERFARMSRKERGEEIKQKERARHEASAARKAKAAHEAKEAVEAPKNAVAAERQAEKAAANTASAQKQAERVGRARAAQRDKAKAAAAAAIASTKGGKAREDQGKYEGKDTARDRWGLLRHSEAMRHAIASTQWSAVLKALRENDAQLTAAREALAAAKTHVATLDHALDARLKTQNAPAQHAGPTSNTTQAVAPQSNRPYGEKTPSERAAHEIRLMTHPPPGMAGMQLNGVQGRVEKLLASESLSDEEKGQLQAAVERHNVRLQHWQQQREAAEEAKAAQKKARSEAKMAANRAKVEAEKARRQQEKQKVHERQRLGVAVDLS